MILKIMCHRPRTQRLGMDSMDREVELFCGEEEEARKVIKDLRETKNRMVRAGYPWAEGEVHGIQTLPNDTYYLVVEEESEDD